MFYRIADVALGAAVGLVVNAIIVPPEYLSEARDLIVTRARGQAELLRNLSEVVVEGNPVRWELRTQLWALFKASGVTAALDRGKDSLRGNIRSRAWRRVGGDRIYRPAAVALDRTLISLAGVVVGVEGLSKRSEEGVDYRGDIAELLDKVADSLEELANDPARHRTPYASMTTEHLPSAMRLSDIVHSNVAEGGADTEAMAAIALGVDAITSTLQALGETD